jgi:crossover junction endodeoxyribonuclease RuvC
LIRLLGLDPGLQRTGWGVIMVDGPALGFVAAGVVASDAAAPLADRLLALFRGLEAVIDQHRPAEVAVEETVVNKNALSSLKLGHARGVVLLAASTAGLPVAEYAAKHVKRALTGTGGALKPQVAHMVQVLLPRAGPVTADAADALAVAVCHAHNRATVARLATGRVMGAVG